MTRKCELRMSQPMFDDLPGTYGSGGASLATLDDGRVMLIWHSWRKKSPSAGRSVQIAQLLVT